MAARQGLYMSAHTHTCPCRHRHFPHSLAHSHGCFQRHTADVLRANMCNVFLSTSSQRLRQTGTHNPTYLQRHGDNIPITAHKHTYTHAYLFTNAVYRGTHIYICTDTQLHKCICRYTRTQQAHVHRCICTHSQCTDTHSKFKNTDTYTDTHIHICNKHRYTQIPCTWAHTYSNL